MTVMSAYLTAKSNRIMERKDITRLQRSIAKLNAELQAFAKETGEGVAPTLYEDAYTTYRVTNISITANGKKLSYLYDFCDGRGFFHQSETIAFYEDAADFINFWKAGLRRAKKYWSMDTEELDAIYDFKKEDINIEED